MSDSSTTPTEKELAFARFYQELEEADDKPAVVHRFATEYPPWSAEFRQQAVLGRGIDAPEPAPVEVYPDSVPDFHIVREIGRGGKGVVFEAWQESLKRRVALKIMRVESLPSERERFRREQLILARLHQTHIVPVHTTGQVGPWQYYAMAYIEGAALHHVVRRTAEHATDRARGQTPTLAELAREELASRKSGTNGPAATGTPSTAAAAPWPEARTLTLPTAYWRSVAEILAGAAEAVEHAHRAGVLHRDLKPHNVMVDTSGQSWLIDFGLARGPNDGEAGSVPEASEPQGADGPLTVGPMGTPAYMAPEQWRGGAVNERTDVWGLGVTLYELLTLRPAFSGTDRAELQNRILHAEPAALHRLVKNIPSDLAAICRKALRKEPAERYRTAGEFAADLRRWLNGLPTSVTPLRRSAALWVRRNRGWAAAIAVSLAALLATGGVLVRLNQLAAQEIRNRDRESKLQDAQRIRLTPHANGWSETCWELVRKAAGLRKGDDVRDQSAATLLGLDAKLVKQLNLAGSSAIAFHPDGKRLLMGGYTEQLGEGLKYHTGLLWGGSVDAPTPTNQVGDGPVAFAADGTPLQFVLPTKQRNSFQVWDVARQQALHEFRTADAVSFPIPDGQVPEVDAAVFSADGSLVAVATSSPGHVPRQPSQGTVTVWDVRSGQRLRQISRPATGLALSPDGKLLAVGDGDGTIAVWPLPAGDPLATLQADRVAILGLAFGRSVYRRSPDRTTTAGTGWLLAAGDAGGRVVIWDLEQRTPQAHCRGSYFDIYAVGFSPDGMTLATAGRGTAKLWDVATGRELLDLHGKGCMTGLAWSRDGRKLAVSAISVFGDGGVDVWELENGRGMRTLRGLAGQVSHIVLSPDGKWIAALAHNWQVGLWDTLTGDIRHVIDVPRGLIADNAALAFSGDGRRLAFAAGLQAKTWDVESGRQLGSWDLPPGLADRIAFHSSGKLLLFRMETESGEQYPASNAPPQEFPRIARLRELQGGGELREIRAIKDHNGVIVEVAVAPDGSYFVADGLGVVGAEKRRSINAYDGLTGNLLWSAAQEGKGWGRLMPDPSGKVLVLRRESKLPVFDLVEMPSGKLLDTWSFYVGFIGPAARLYGFQQFEPPYGLRLYRPGNTNPLVTLGLDVQTSSRDAKFNVAGSHVAWGNADGTVLVCDLVEVQKRLAGIGLGW